MTGCTSKRVFYKKIYDLKPTLEQFSKMIPRNNEPEKWYSIAIPLFEKYQVNTSKRLAAFMAQSGHESLDFKVLQENLNYTADRLYQIFSGFFTNRSHAQQFHRKPELIANFVYDDRHPARKNKIGNIYDGDGWKFRGSGIIQLTGRWNYLEFADYMNMTIDEVVAYIRTKKGALESALWFWTKNHLNELADRDDIVSISKRVNGGEHGLQDRINRYNRNKELLEETVELKRGSRGDSVKEIQKILGLITDGIFGPRTEAAVKYWQLINNYMSNGILTKEQILSMKGL